MRGNSGFLRWLPSFAARASGDFGRHTALVVVALALLVQSSRAGPVNARHRRMMREVYTDLETKNQTEVQPEAGTCFQDGLQVPESTVQCDKKPGCRPIQKTGYCCPDYQCECEQDGKIYTIGEKLVDPNTPCKVCHCKGGEITCSNVTCYERSDCEPKYIPGRCCPEYDNCPPLEHVKPGGSKEALPETQSTSIAPPEHVSNSPSSTMKPEITNSNPLGIKIKEITKPEEIRIIDEKPKQVFPITKPSDVLAINPVKVSSSKESPSMNSMEFNDQPPEDVPASLSSTSSENKSTNNASDETVNKLEMADVNTVNAEDSQKTVRHTGAVGANKNESQESPEAASAEDKKAAESQTGKEVVIVDRNGNSKPITVFGSEGLERGDVAMDGGSDNGTSSEKDDDRKPAQDLELAASSSDDIRVLPLNTPRSPERTTEGLPLDSSIIFDTVLYTANPESAEASPNLTDIVFDTVYHEDVQGTGPLNITTEGPKVENHPHHHVDDYDSTSNEPNPAYPTIEDDLSNYGRDDTIPPLADDYLEASHKAKSADHADEPHVSEEAKISTEGVPLMSTKLLAQAASDELKVSTEGLEEAFIFQGMPIGNLSDVDLIPAESRLAAPGEPLLVPEWERNTTTTNDTDAFDDVLRDDIIDAGSGSGGGSGFGQIKLDGTGTPLKGVSVIDDFEEFLAGGTDDHNTGADSVTYNEGVDASADSSPFLKALETMHTYQKGYLNVF